MSLSRRRFLGSGLAATFLSGAPISVSAEPFSAIAAVKTASTALSAIQAGLSLLGIGRRSVQPSIVPMLRDISEQIATLSQSIIFLSGQIEELRIIVKDIPDATVDELSKRQLISSVTSAETILAAYGRSYEIGEEVDQLYVNNGRIFNFVDQLAIQVDLAMQTQPLTLLSPLLVAAYRTHIELSIISGFSDQEVKIIVQKYKAWFDKALDEQWLRTDDALRRHESLLLTADYSFRNFCAFPEVQELDKNNHFEFFTFYFGQVKYDRNLVPLREFIESNSDVLGDTSAIKFGSIHSRAFERLENQDPLQELYFKLRRELILVGGPGVEPELEREIVAPRVALSAKIRMDGYENFPFIPDWPDTPYGDSPNQIAASYLDAGGGKLGYDELPRELRLQIERYEFQRTGLPAPIGVAPCEEAPQIDGAYQQVADELFFAALSVAVESRNTELLLGAQQQSEAYLEELG